MIACCRISELVPFLSERSTKIYVAPSVANNRHVLPSSSDRPRSPRYFPAVISLELRKLGAPSCIQRFVNNKQYRLSFFALFCHRYSPALLCFQHVLVSFCKKGEGMPSRSNSKVGSNQPTWHLFLHSRALPMQSFIFQQYAHSFCALAQRASFVISSKRTPAAKNTGR
jgi:hypothetical protein